MSCLGLDLCALLGLPILPAQSVHQEMMRSSDEPNKFCVAHWYEAGICRSDVRLPAKVALEMPGKGRYASVLISCDCTIGPPKAVDPDLAVFMHVVAKRAISLGPTVEAAGQRDVLGEIPLAVSYIIIDLQRYRLVEVRRKPMAA
eukprot:4622680-Amphidinium_carterae.1